MFTRSSSPSCRIRNTNPVSHKRRIYLKMTFLSECTRPENCSANKRVIARAFLLTLPYVIIALA